MPAAKQPPFSYLLKNFTKSLSGKREGTPPRIVLVIMANTHDKTLSKECKKDMNTVRTVFKSICKYFKFDFCSIDIAGKNYSWDNLDKAFDAIPIPGKDDVMIFYYTGHGFSYKDDRFSKYPQLDMRPHNKPVDLKDIYFIKRHTVNVEAVLNILRFRGCRVNIAIADCCNTTIPYKRPQLNEHDMTVSNKILPPKSKALTKKIYEDETNDISILVGSSQFGQPAVTDGKIGSLFTHFFAKALAAAATAKKAAPYIPWVKIFKKAAALAFKESKGYDVGGGVPGKQKAVFQVYAGNGI